MIKNNQKNTIALYLPSLRGGGAERVTVLLANGLVNRGFSVDLVICDAHGPYKTDLDEKINIIDLETDRVSRSLLKLTRYLMNNKPVALISAMSHANIIAILAKILSRANTNLIVVEHNTFSRIKNNLKVKLLSFFMRLLYPYANHIAGVSKGVAEDLAEAINLPIDRISILYNPVVSQKLIAQAMEPCTHPWLIEKKFPVFLGIGRLTEQKDFSTLIKAFYIVRQQIEAQLIILGEGEQRLHLESLVAQLKLTESVSLPGFTKNPFSYLKQATAFVLSSRWEGLPTVLIEALACETHVISTNCPSGAAEILDNGRYGVLVEIQNVEQLADAMKNAIDQPVRQGTLLRAYDFSIEKSVNAYLALIRVPDHSN